MTREDYLIKRTQINKIMQQCRTELDSLTKRRIKELNFKIGDQVKIKGKNINGEIEFIGCDERGLLNIRVGVINQAQRPAVYWLTGVKENEITSLCCK